VPDSSCWFFGATTPMDDEHSLEIPSFKGFHLSAFLQLNGLIRSQQVVLPLYQLKMRKKLAMKNCTCNDHNHFSKPGVVCLFVANPKQQIA
jgi:hypothetical protein